MPVSRRAPSMLFLAAWAAVSPLAAFAISIPSNTWVQQPAPTQVLPSGVAGSYEGRGWNHMRYDVVSGRMVLYDGYNDPPDDPPGNIYANALWTYDPVSNRLALEKRSNWTRVNGATIPLPANTSDPTPYDRHSYACLVYASEKNALYLWSGANNSVSSNHLGDTWCYEFPTKSWREITAPHPYTFFEQAMAYDQRHGKLVLSGGAATDYGGSTHTYVFDLSTETWSEPSLASEPATRYGQTLVYDPARAVVWMFGGGPYGQAANELWYFNAQANTWSQVPASGSWPDARRFANMAYDTRRNQILLWGGVTASNDQLTDTWSFDPASRVWQRLSPAASPPGDTHNFAEDMDYDPVNDFFVLNRSGTFWLYRPGGSSSPQAAGPGVSFRVLSANPGRGGTRFSFTLTRDATVRIDLVDSLGRRVSTLVSGRFPQGVHEVDWAGGSSRRTPSGVYYVRFTSEGRVLTRRVVIVR